MRIFKALGFFFGVFFSLSVKSRVQDLQICVQIFSLVDAQNRFMTYFPCLLRLSFFARIQSRLPFSGLPRICLIFSLIKIVVWKLWLRTRSISQKSVDFLVSTIPCWILFIIGFRIMHFHMISIVYYFLLPSFYKRVFFQGK